MSVPAAILSLFVFQNLFNAFSPYITLAINLVLALTLLALRHGRCTFRGHFVVLSAFAVLAWLFLVTVVRGDVELQVLLKYSRVAINITLFALIFGTQSVSATALVKAINFALAFHVLLVMLQVVLPDLTYATAPIFGFEREITILEEFTMRKLGASSSYDTASLFSVAALIFFYLQFSQGRGTRYFSLSVIAFIATLMSSRAGIALSMLIVVVIGFRALFKATLPWKVVAASGIGAIVVFAYVFISPLVLHSLGISQLQSEDVGMLYSIADYGTTGTLESLTNEHLRPLDRPFVDLLFGYGIDPNSVGRVTDIGYVKFIYHIGIVGLLIIVFTHLYMLVIVRKCSRRFAQHPDRALIARFSFLFIVIGLVFNYKSLELHSRGVGDLIFILFLCVASWCMSDRPPRRAATPAGALES
ncbi:MAG: hypothetical protein U0974_11745 [Gemmatimonadales bacterium]|nr:hypothetical protein [Gemmatimonadales bacterium]MDZ4390388.1 hypothetical protein [Gemmatimonadales bacterium]